MSGPAARLIGAAVAAAGDTPIAVGWATVDSERAIAALEAELHIAPAAFAPASDSTALGARCLVARRVLPGGGALVVIEPATEGLLAATLARHDEGPRVVWVMIDDVGVRVASRATPGPFGPERLVPGASSDDLRRLLVSSRAGYHPRMTNQATVTLRLAVPIDAEPIATLFTDEGYPAGPTDIVARLERFANPKARVIVAEHDGALLGFIAIHALPRFEHDDWIVRILALVVDAGARERGVGRTLMVEAERVGRELGASFIEVTAGHHRPDARHLYDSLGYDATVTAYLRKKL